MKIKLLKNYNNISKGIILPVRKLCSIADAVTYQVIDGPHIGAIFQDNSKWFFEIDEDEKKYTEKEWNDLENYYLAEFDKERQAKDRAINLVTEVSKQLLKKNEQIRSLEFIVSALTIGLTASTEAISILRKQGKA